MANGMAGIGKSKIEDLNREDYEQRPNENRPQESRPRDRGVDGEASPFDLAKWAILNNNNNLLSTSGGEYVKTLDTIFKETYPSYIIGNADIQDMAARVILDTVTNFCCILIFPRICTNIQLSPSEYTGEIFQSYKDKNPKLKPKLLDGFVIIPEDYSLVENMAKTIFKVLDSKTDQKSMLSLADQRRSWAAQEFRISENIDDVKNYIQSQSPHAVASRADYGFLLYLRKRRTPKFTGDLSFTDIPYLAVTGYTQFSKNMHYRPGLDPSIKRLNSQVVISDVVSCRNYNEFISITLPLAKRQFIDYGTWKNHYRNSTTSGDIGNLIIENGKPLKCKTKDQIDAVFGSEISDPCLTLEIPDGRARLTGIDALADMHPIKDHKTGEIIKDSGLEFQLKKMEDFTGSKLNFSGSAIEALQYSYEGVVKAATGEFIDTRKVDCLFLMKHIDDYVECGKLLARTFNPSKRIEIISKNCQEFKVLYCITQATFNTAFVDSLGRIWDDILSHIHFEYNAGAFPEYQAPDLSAANSFNYSIGAQSGSYRQRAKTPYCFN